MHDTTVATTTMLILLLWGGVGALFFWEWFLRDALRRFRRRSRLSQALVALGVAALVVIGGIKPGNSPLRTPPPDIPPPSLSTNQCLAGFALVAADTNAAFSLDAPTNAVVHTNWLLRGASRDAFTIESTAERPWSFRLGTNRLRRVWVSAGGTVSFAGPFDSATGPLPNASAPDHLAPFHATLGIVPEANWQPPFSPCVFWHDTTEAGSLRLTWRNALFDRDANTPVSFQTELFPSGDFVYRYDFGDTTPTNAVIGAQHNGGGESWTNPASAQRVELRWRHFSGIEPGAVDTDGDGLSDYDEVFVHGTDPARADSDGDGIADGGDSAPNNADADGDGFPDGATAATWSAHPFLAENAGFTNLVLSVARGLAPPLRSGPTPAASALLDIGGLKTPLRTGEAIPLGLPGGVEITAALRVRGNLPVRLQLSPGPTVEPFRLIDPEGIFSHGTSADASARLSFPLLSLDPLTDTGTGCLHEGDTGAEFQAVLLPSGWDDALAVAEIEGFYLQTAGTLWLNGPEPPFATNTGTVTIRPPWLRWGTLSASASVHWCASGGSYCHACGTVHTATDSCTHDADCAARFSDEAECDCTPIFLRVNFDDDDFNDVEDRNETPDAMLDDELEEFRFVGSGGCCCAVWQSDANRARIAALSPGLRLWSADGTRLLPRDEVAESAWIEATARSMTNGAFSLSYDILDPTGGVVRAMSRRFTAANVEILPDMDENGVFDVDDRLLRETLGPGGTWKVVRREEPCRVRLRNACPEDATLRVLWSTEGTNGPAFSTDSNLTTQYLAPNSATTNAPFALPNLVDEFLIDVSRTSSVATLTYSLDVGGASPTVADSLAIRIVDIDLPVRAVRPSELAGVEYDLSAASSDVSWILRDAETGGVVDWWYGPVYLPPANLAFGDYGIEAYVWDVWEDGMEGAMRTAILRVADIAIEREAYATIADSAHRAMVSAAVSNVTGAISWIIEPALENGARLLSSPSSGSGAISLSGVTNVWISPGSIVRDYVVTARSSSDTNIADCSTVYVGRVNIDGDFYRNGGFADHPAEASAVDFLSSTGMVIIANNDDDNGDEEADFLAEPSSSPHAGEFRVNGAGDLAKMHRLRISPLAIPSSLIPTNWMVRVDFEAVDEFQLNNGLHFFWNLAADAQGYPSFGLSNQTLRNTLGGFADPREIGVEGFKYGSEYTVTLKLLEGETAIASDMVRILVAPFLVLSNAAETQHVYFGAQCNDDFAGWLRAAVPNAIPCTEIGTLFIQDPMEIGWTPGDPTMAGDNVVLGFNSSFTWLQELLATNVQHTAIDIFPWNLGGNIEASPPSPGNPFGRIIVGNNTPATVKQFLRDQSLQTDNQSLIEIPTQWLKVGHIDEIFTIIPKSNGYVVVVADLKLAIKILKENSNQNCVYCRSTNELLDYYTNSVHQAWIDQIDSTLSNICSTLSSSLSVPMNAIVRAPVLYNLDTSSSMEGTLLPNMVNMLIVREPSGSVSLIIPDSGFDPFSNYFVNALGSCGFMQNEVSVVFIDTTQMHYLGGEVHCATTQIRRPLP